MARNGIRLNLRGQTSVEFLFIFLIMLFYLQVVVQPEIFRVSTSVITLHRAGQAKMIALRLVNSVNELNALSGESSETMWLYIPEKVEIVCNNPTIAEPTGSIAYNIQVDDTKTEESFLNCTKADPSDTFVTCRWSMPVAQDAVLNCDNFPPVWGDNAPVLRVRVFKTAGAVRLQQF